MTIRLVLLGSRFLFFFFLVAVAFSGVFASNGGMKMEKTFAMIKPDGLRGNYTDRIKGAIVESGFRILEERIVQLDEDRASRFYAEHSSKSFFFSLVKYMTSGPVCIMVLEKQNAIADWRALIGPTDAVKAKATHPNSIRAMCGLDSQKNCVHGSDSLLSAQREISFFFEEETELVVSELLVWTHRAEEEDEETAKEEDDREEDKKEKRNKKKKKGGRENRRLQKEEKKENIYIYINKDNTVTSRGLGPHSLLCPLTKKKYGAPKAHAG